jgi:hypothetical protein
MSPFFLSLASNQAVEHAIMAGRVNVDLNPYFASIEQELCTALVCGRDIRCRGESSRLSCRDL